MIPPRFALLLLTLTPAVFAAEIGGGGAKSGALKPENRAPEPHLQPASDEPRKAMAKFQLPTGFTADVWAAEPMLGNPVAFDIDDQGRVFTSETYRYRTSVLDIRHYLFMLEDDMACRTTDDRIAMSKRNFPNDWKDLEKQTEIVRVLEDTKGAGHADSSRVHADGFTTMLDGIASGVLAHDGQVFFTNIPNLWRMTGLAADGRAEKKESLSFGYGVRFSFTGHDMHGLALGPDGRLYFSFGDRGAHVVTKEGRTLAFPDEGAVFRCELDGSQMEVVHRGLRNPQELAFDDYGNLFTGDNDCDQGDRERWVQIVEGGDSGWRVGWQHPPLGKERNMWLTEKLWKPREADTPAWVLSPILNIPDGPSGVVHNPGTGLPAEYDDAFFVCGFKGSSARSAISWWKVKPDGAGFAVEKSPATFIDNVQATDVDFGPDSRMYFSEWGEGWEGTGRGRIFTLEHAAARTEQAAQIAEVQRLLKEGFKQRSTDELARLLAHKDQRIRLRAQWALAGKAIAQGQPTAEAQTVQQLLEKIAVDGAEGPEKNLSRLHAVWGLGQIIRGYFPASGAPQKIHQHGEIFAKLLHHADPEVQAQFLRIVSDLRGPFSFSEDLAQILVWKLTSPSPRVRFFAALALAKGADSTAAPAIMAMLKGNADRDQNLRHAGAMALARCGEDAITMAAKDESRSVRLAALLALRRAENAAVAEFLNDSDPALVQEAARAINDVGIAAGYPALVALLAKPTDGQNLTLRALNAAFRSGDAAALAKFAADTSRTEPLRVEAIRLLGTWPKPAPRDRVAGVYRPLPAREAGPAIAALSPELPKLLSAAFAAATRATLDAIVALGMKDAGDPIRALLADRQAPAKLRVAALETLTAIEDPKLIEAAQLAANDEQAAVRVAANVVLARLSPDDAAPQLRATFTDAAVPEKRQILSALASLAGPGTDRALVSVLEEAQAGKVPREVHLELIEAASKRPAPEVKQKLDAWVAQEAAADKLGRFSFALVGGDAENGEKLFKEHAVAQCFRCHKINESGGDAGPDLTKVAAQKDRRYLLEAIVDPGAKIAHGFESVICTMTSGDIKAGLLKGETADSVILQLPVAGAEPETLKKAEIKSRDVGPSGMPPGLGELLSKRELRDIMEYISTLK
jgi:quinoprotein glucose dehydrogenase